MNPLKEDLERYLHAGSAYNIFTREFIEWTMYNKTIQQFINWTPFQSVFTPDEMLWVGFAPSLQYF